MKKHKLIVTHGSPDLDAVMSVWILKKFDRERFGEAQTAFVLAGDEISDSKLRELGTRRAEVVHVDTGMGEFDHHTEELADKPVCAASLVRDRVVEVHPELGEDEALERMVEHAVKIDHFEECYWPEANNDRYMFQLSDILKHIKTVGGKDEDVVKFGIQALDAIYAGFGSRVAAEEEMKKGREFETRWGKALGVVSNNDEVVKYAQKEGYRLVVRKDPDEYHVRIKAVPGKEIDLTEVYEKIREKDPEATWFLHPAKTMLLNGSRKHEGQVPSGLGLEEVVEILKSV